jgi:hypothetical protein
MRWVRSKRVPQALHARHRRLDNGGVGRDVHRRGVRVVGALALVHVVVGVHGAVALPQRAACKDVRAVRHHFVDVHVALRARPRLPNHQRKLIVKLAGQDFVARRHNEVLLRRVQRPEFAVGCGRRALQVRKRSHDFHGHGTVRPDFEVVA